MPALKGYEYSVDGLDGISTVVGQTAGKARYAAWLRLQDCFPDLRLIDVRVRRSPSSDMEFPDLSPAVEDLDWADREIVLHMFGGHSHLEPSQWGYRNHYCCAPDEPRLNRLVSLGLATGPHGANEDGETPGWSGAFFYLTDDGKTAARALIGARECR